MGIKLDWEIEAEQTVVRGNGEDKVAQRRRRLAQLRLLIGILALIAVFGGIYGFFTWRLQLVDGEIRRALIDTVNAEVTTLRVSDRNSYLDIQRSASEAWVQTQGNTFEDYQALKVDYDVQLTGNVVNVEVDGSRGRVQVEEIIDGIPYVQTWFYWRYADVGWRHVPPDYTFWGAEASIDNGQVEVRYRGMDAPVANDVAASVTGWVTFACGALNCEGMPPIVVNIIPVEGLTVRWSELNNQVLEVPSPFVGRARYDRPFDTPLQTAVAAAIAERIIEQSMGTVQPVPTSDAAYLKRATQDWLVGHFTQVDTRSYLLDSYTARYGENALKSALQTVNADSNLQVLGGAVGAGSLAQLEVDWRDYIEWLLAVEDELKRQGNQAMFVSLYDVTDPAIAGLAEVRFLELVPDATRQVASVQLDAGANSVPILRAVVRVGEADQIIEYRLVSGLWKRIN